MRAVATRASRCRVVLFVEQTSAVRATSVLVVLVGCQTVLCHQVGIFVTTCARARNVGWEDVAPGVVRWKDRVRVVAVGAGRRVSTAPLQKELTMPTGSELRELVGW